jgi:hypothetical protein
VVGLIVFMHIVPKGQLPNLEYRTPEVMDSQRSTHPWSSSVVVHLLYNQSMLWLHLWSEGTASGCVRVANVFVKLSDRLAATVSPDTIGDAKVEWRWLTVKKITMKDMETNFILEAKYRY